MTMTTRSLRQLTEQCLLCHNAACDSACPNSVPISGIIRSVYFDNLAGARSQMQLFDMCARCVGHPCVQSCVRAHIDAPVNIDKIVRLLIDACPSVAYPSETQSESSPPDLSVEFCGVHCENPFFLSSSVVASNEEMVAKAFEMGWAGVAFKTIGTFVPDEVSPRFDVLENDVSRMSGFKNIEQISDHPLEENIRFIQNLKARYPSKIIIASIMGQDEEEWTYLAKEMERAGADIIECNFSCPHMSAEGLGSDVGTNPEWVRRYTLATRRGTDLPILAKMTPNIANMEIPALAATAAGADGIAAINTIKSVMNINLDTYASGPDVIGKSAVGGYSGKAVKPIALRFIQDLKHSDRLRHYPISGMGGIETWRDAAEFISLGCETVQITTAVMLYGYRIIDDLIDGLTRYLYEHGYSSVNQMVGRAIPHLISADALDRQTIEYPHFHKDRCIGCGRCYVSCFDGGHQAITVGADRKPKMTPQKCVGCQLCRLVCPAQAISSGKRVAIKKGT